MPELREVFEMITKQIEPDQDSWNEHQQRQRRSARNRKFGALAVAAVIVATIAVFAATALNRGKEGSAPATVVPSRSGVVFTVVGLDGVVRSTIPVIPEGTIHPDVSPDGSTVAFAFDMGSGSQIATMRLDGTDFRTLTTDSISADRPRWSPDGSRLVFYQVDQVGNILSLMVMDADGTNVREISGTRTPRAVPPDWSPDGSLILYTSLSGAEGLATVPVAGGRSHRLTSSLIPEGAGTWSPDGSTIALRRLMNFNYEIWLMNADGSGLRRLATLPNAAAQGPEWSPDGSTIAFIGSVSELGIDDESDAIYLVDVASGNITEVLRGIAPFDLYDSRATWLPGGDALLVLTETPGTASTGG